MRMPKVKHCKVKDCAYNTDDLCHAIAITIGDEAVHPRCDTFLAVDTKGGDDHAIAGVGACKVDVCMFNTSFECQAQDILVGFQQAEIDCLTFKSRR